MDHLARTSKQIGALIQRRRKVLDLTQKDLGERAGLRQATISQIERGEGGRLENVLAILASLDLELVVRERTRAGAADIEDVF